MLAQSTLAKLFSFKSKFNSDHCLKWKLLVELSFEANAQVSYKDENDSLKIKRFRASQWETQLFKSSQNLSALELKVFVYTPNLRKDEEIRLAICLDNETVEEQTFKILMENEYAGWFGLMHEPQI